MLKEEIVNELIESGKTGASVFIVKTNKGKIKVTSNHPNSKSQLENAGYEVVIEISTSGEVDLDEARAEEIIEFFYDDEELEKLEELL